MTGYQSKRAAALDKLAHMTFEQRCRVSEQCLPDAPYREMLTNLHDEMLAALAQPEQPDTDMAYTIALQRAIEWHCKSKVVPPDVAALCPHHAEKLNKALAQPPQRPWVGLTPEEILDLFDVNNVYGSKWIEFARAVEAKLKEKNT